MVVYLEWVFLDNFIIDFLLVLITRKALKLRISKLRIALSAFFGATVALIIPFLKLSTAVTFLLKMPIGLLIVLISGKFRGIKEFIYCFYLFLFFTFLFGGGVTAIFWGLNLNFNPLNYTVESEIPLFVSVLTAVGVYLLCKKTINRIYRRKTLLNFVYKCQFSLGGEDFEFLGFLDSGNSLFYGADYCPIVVCGKNAVLKLQKTGALENTKKDIVFVNTVGGKTLISVYKTQKFLIYNGLIPNILYNVMIGVPEKFVDFKEYDILLGSSMVGG
ncbi:MAG: hypothetical protein E7360_00430 [Clostridiales bacterium]|nr:hypothetical protein [Clostridiales bacterium]